MTAATNGAPHDATISATQVRWAGDRSLLAEFDSLEAAMSAHGTLIESPLPGQLDAIAGARTVLVRLGGHVHTRRARAELEQMEFALRTAASEQEVVIDVVYDGPDLADAANFLNMSPEALVAWHSSQRWMGAFPGFAGFTYCVADGQSFQMPRRTSPRTLVPGGSVALAGEFSGVYPRDAPGGWQLIGRTNAVMWDLRRDKPSLVQPWDTVIYRHVTPDAIEVAESPERTAPSVGTSTGAGGAHSDGDHIPAGVEPRLEVINPGMQTLIEDFGREGSAYLGAGLAGVMDRRAARDANHAVGNEPDAAVLEVLFGGFTARALSTTVLAVTGADVDVTVKIEGAAPRPAPLGDPVIVLAGETITLGAPRSGARSVIALRGGVWAPASLGSSSTDTLVKLGPPPVAAGDIIPSGDAIAGAVMTARDAALRTGSPKRDAGEPESNAADDTTILRVVFGPRDFWFSAEEQQRLLDQRWIVTPDSNRIGIRFTTDTAEVDARPLKRIRTGELLSEGMALGSLQVPPSGTPVLLANDQGITGGYPIIAVVLAQDLSLAAQLAPGNAVRFTAVNAETLKP